MFIRYASGINFEVNTAVDQGLPYQVAGSCHQKWDTISPDPGDGAAMPAKLTRHRKRSLDFRITGGKTEFRARRGDCESTGIPEAVDQRHEALECKLHKLDGAEKALGQALLTKSSGLSPIWSRIMPLEPR
ncbi:hypothetical protein [Bradyrhizobium sp. 25ACV]